MNNIMKSKKHMIIGFTAILIFIVLSLGIKFTIHDFVGISPLAISLLLGGILCIFIFFGCIYIWVYKDAILRGENGFLWALIVFLTSPFIGMIIYLISRKEEKRNCKGCGERINMQANFCEYCGIENDNQEEYIMKKTNKSIKLIAAGVMAAVLMIGCFTVFTVLAFSSDNFIDKDKWNTGVISMSYSNSIGNKWTFNFKSASDGYRKSNTLKIKDNSQILYAEIECGEGELLLHIKQGNKQETIDVSSLEQPLEYPLKDFELGKITIIMEINGAKNVKSYITIK